jgi:hypothetical protein
MQHNNLPADDRSLHYAQADHKLHTWGGISSTTAIDIANHMGNGTVDSGGRDPLCVMLIAGCTYNNGRPTKLVRRSAVITKT